MKAALLLVVLAAAGNNFVVAHDGRVELIGAWNVEGVAHPSSIATSAERIAVVDSLANEMRVVDLATGRGETIGTGETPVAAAFIGRDLYVLARDARRLQKIGGASVGVARDPAFMRVAGDRVYVYSRLDGVVQEIDPIAMRVTRTLSIAPFASDFEIDGHTGYLVFPQEAKLRTFSTESMKAEEAESFGHAFARGFLRGLLGIDVAAPKVPEIPAGVDRLLTRGSTVVAYDSMSETLYRLSRSKARPIASGVSPEAFAVTSRGVAVWQNGALRLIR